jgi:SAM-dependent methyltransferase
MGAERYDRAYFDRWYRVRGFGSPVRLQRKVDYALGSVEYLLDRPVRSVLDVGCGEGAWGLALRRARPAVRYVGIDPSRYAVSRYGRRRGLVQGGFGDLGDLGLEAEGPFDLVVCCDVLPYVSDADLRRGLPALGDLVGGAAFLEVWTASDDVEGDLDGFRRRRAATYLRWFAGIGLRRVGPHLYIPPSTEAGLGALEQPV